MISQSEEDYLRAIYELQHEQGNTWVTTTGLAQVLGVSPASVTEMLQKLAAPERDLLSYERYHGVRLRNEGKQVALEVVRHHRLLETFLSRALGYSWDEVHDEAHRLEHAISEAMEARMAAYLGEPQRDPHGAPIPDRDGVVMAVEDMRLTDFPVGQQARIQRVSNHDPALLRYLAEMGLLLDTPVRIMGREPFEGPLRVQLLDTGTVHALGKGVTDHVFVVPNED